MIRIVAPFIAAIAVLTAASTAGAAPAAKVCTPFKLSGFTILSQTVGNSWSCAAAKTWIVKLAGDQVAPSSVNVALKNGPHGLHCLATPRKQNHALDGTCVTGTLAFPGNGFAWHTR